MHRRGPGPRRDPGTGELSPAGLAPISAACRVCAAASLPLGTAKVLSKHEVAYFRCPACGFVQTEAPHWLAEAYATPIVQTDVGLVQRNLDLSRMLRVLLPLLADPGGRFVDYGGGYGLLVRLMRDAGFDYRWLDENAENLFAPGFEAKRGDRYELLSAFEVFEHLEDPRAGLRDMLALSDRVLFSTHLLPEPCPKPGDWWYYGLDHGQHISFYTAASLEALAAGAGAHFHTNGINIHMIARERVSERRFRFAVGRKAALLAPLFRRPSLLQDDFNASLKNPTRKPS